MSLKWKALIVAAVFAGGFGAAMFFRKDGDAPPAAPDSPEVAIQPPREIPRLVPLRVTGEAGVSPAAEALTPVPSQKPELSPVEGPLWQPQRTDLDAPPDIGTHYTPLADPFGATADGRPSLPDVPSLPSDPSLVPIGSGVPAGNAPKLRRYTLRDGDTLAKLADKYLGNAAKAREIYEANRVVLTSPDILPIGVEIVLPGLRATDD